MHIRFIVPLLSFGLAAACAAPAATPTPTAAADEALEGEEPYTFHLVVGSDTIASDVVRRSGTQTEVDLALPNAGVRSLITMEIGADERMEMVDIRNYRIGAPGADPIQSVRMELDGDSVRAERSTARRGVQRVVVPTDDGAVGYIQGSGAMVEQVLRRARALGGETATVPVLDLMSLRTAPAVVRWTDAGTAVVTYGDMEVHAVVAEDGALVEYTVPMMGARAVRTEGAHPLVSRDR